MARSRQDGVFEVKPFPIIGQYNTQRFKQWSPEDSANWYVVKGVDTKRPYAMYPVLGRRHITYLGFNQLIFGAEPRGIFKTIQFAYVVIGNTIYRVDANFNQLDISQGQLQSLAGNIYFAYLVVNNIVFACFVDDQKIYVYQENINQFFVVTDINAPGNDGNGKPGFIAAFGNRIAVSVAGSSQFILSVVNLLNTSGVFDPTSCFTNATGQVFAQENGIIRQMGVLNNTLYIFCDFITGVWSNIPAVFSGTNTTFPWKKNSTYDWNYGIANPQSLDIDFGIMAFLAQNSDGLLQFMVSNGNQPVRISSKAIDTLLQRYTNALGSNNPFTANNSSGFLYQYENSIIYRMSGGVYHGYGLLDQTQQANSIEYNFEVEDWHRVIELNGERNRIQRHIYFNNKHLVTLSGEGTVYEMSGQYYFNEIRNPAQPDPQEIDSYIAEPFRYERITSIISEEDYSEFETEYVEIDFVWGDSNINFSMAPFSNAQFLVAEQLLDGQPQYVVAENLDQDGQPIFVIGEIGNTPTIFDNYYNDIFKPTIELYFSDDGGRSFQSADVREFSQAGVHIWKMRWYQLGPSRNRVYKLIAVSPVPIVILGGVMNVRRISGGAN